MWGFGGWVGVRCRDPPRQGSPGSRAPGDIEQVEVKAAVPAHIAGLALTHQHLRAGPGSGI